MTTFSLGGVTIYGYGAAVALAAVLALVLAHFQVRRAGLKSATLSTFALLALPLCLLLSRLAYCLIRLGWFTQKGAGWFFNFTSGGYVLYGALAGGLIAAYLASRLTRQSFGRVCDALAAPTALLIGLSRLAEGLADEGFGWDMETWFSADSGMSLFHPEDPASLFFFPLGYYREAWDTWYFATFVFAALIALVICVILLRVRPRFDGDRTLLLLLLYGAMQALCESMRQDSVLRWGFVRSSQVISAVVVAAVLLIYCRRMTAGPGRKARIARSWIELLCGMLVIIAMEFCVEKKIVFLEWVPTDVCYLIMSLACVGLILCVLPIRRRCAADASRAQGGRVAC